MYYSINKVPLGDVMDGCTTGTRETQVEQCAYSARCFGGVMYQYDYWHKGVCTRTDLRYTFAKNAILV